jgi:type 2 lantibiotic biosynthesis protein LanM
VAADDDVWRDAEWYRALWLAERLPAPQAAVIASADQDAADRGLARASAWKAQKPFGDASLFHDRLAVDSLSEPALAYLLTESAEALKARTAAVPDWLVALRDAFSDRRAAETVGPLLGDVARDHPLAGCLPALGPLLARGVTSLQNAIAPLGTAFGRLPFESDVLSRALLENIAPLILFQISKPFVLEMNIARLQGRLQGETPEARFEQYLRHVNEDGLIASILVKYPVLARQLVLTVEQWTDYLGEFLAHLCADWEAICATFTPGGDPGLLVEVDAGRGDRHRSGRSVLLLGFDSGIQLLYKPKPLGVDIHFQELLSWLNERGAEPALRPLKLLDGGDYGWSEFVAASSCASKDEVTRFYERQGSYLAVLYALDATDLHNENLIAAGEHPMLVDLEALFHPHVYGADPVLAANLAAGALDQSVWQVGLLPRRVWSDDESVGVDMSGLGGEAGQSNPHPVVRWTDEGRDDLRLGRQRVEMAVSDNRPQLNGQDVEVLDYQEAIVRGFTAMYRLLCRHRGALLAEQLPRFARDEIRVVVRSTNVYGLLWYESFHPDLLRDALDRDRHFDRLWTEAVRRPYLAQVIAAERRDLWRGDIPSFSTTPDSRTLSTSEREPLDDFFDAPSLDLVGERVAQLGEQDLRKQTWIIEASLATLLMEGEPYGTPSRRLPVAHPVDKDRLLGLASGIGERLAELSFRNETGAYWLGIGPLDELTWGLFPSGTDLYAGTTGMALFLAYLGAVTGEVSHTRLAHAALRSVRDQVQASTELGQAAPDGNSSALMIGAFDGLGSVIYLLTNLGVLWGDPALLDQAEDLVQELPALISNDQHFDVLYGSAGCLLSLLSLHAIRPAESTLRVAIQCGDRLLAAARPMPRGTGWTTLDGEPPMGGFSHGAAGIALSLLRLAARSGRDRFRTTALEALAFERSLFVPELNNWADVRVFSGRKPGGDRAPASAPRSMVAWCHGAAGIGLGRLGGLDVLDDATTHGEIDTALDSTVAYGFAMNHSLCHGALGNVELLLRAAQVLDRPQDREALEYATAAVVGSVEANGPVTGVPLGVETPGFMTGLAGIGYELLRLAEPDKVPPALLLDPPGWQAA